MNLVGIAKIVAVARIPTLPEKELHAGLKALADAEVELPSLTKKALVQREVYTLTAKVLEGSEEALVSLLCVCRPWRNSKDDDQFDSLKPKIVDLDGSVAEITAVATKYLVKNVLQEILLLGEDKAELVATVCRVSHESFTHNLEGELDEAIEAWVCELTTLWSAFAGLLTPSCLDVSVDNDIRGVKESRKSGKSILSIGKDILISNDFYKEKLRTWELFAPDLKSCSKSMAKISALLKKGDLSMEVAVLDSYREALNSLQVCKLKTRPMCCDELDSDMQRYLSKFADSITSDFAVELQVVKALESLVADASKAYPTVINFKKAGEQIKVALSRVDAQARTVAVGNSFVALAAVISSGETDFALHHLQNISKDIVACDGLEFAISKDIGAALAIILPVCTNFVLVAADAAHAQLAIGLTECFRRFAVKEDQFKMFLADLNAMHLINDAEASIARFSLLGSDITARLDADKNMMQLKLLMSHRKALCSWDLWSNSPAVKARADAVLKTMGSLEGDISDKVFALDEQEVTEALAVLHGVAGGLTDGKVWHELCRDIEDWDLLYDIAKNTICKLDGKQFGLHITNLTKVLTLVQPFVAH